MVPSIDTRLQSIAKALEQVVIPALPADQRLAIEQAEIAVGHLRLLETQWRYVTVAAERELQYLVELATELVATDDGPTFREIKRALDAAALVNTSDIDALRSRAQVLGEAIEQLIESADGLLSNAGARAAIGTHARRQARLERSWFAAAGIAGSDGVPNLAQFLNGKSGRVASEEASISSS